MAEIKIKKKHLKYGAFVVVILSVALFLFVILNQPGDINVKRQLTQQDIAMIEHCKMMPQMAGCDKYLALAKQQEVTGEIRDNKYDRSILGLVSAQESKTLNDKTISLEANIVKKNINGKEIRMYAYNNQIPGPLIKANQGEKIEVNFVNNLDVETTVHWHGLRLENKFDGIPDLTQEPVQPGEDFKYELMFPDSGIYWYHPHVREDYQQELGLYGMILVLPTNSDQFNEVNKEEVLVIDDILIEGGDVPEFDEEYTNLALMGRFGNIMIVNGKTDYSLNVRKGEVVRFYLANVANTRTFKVEIPGAKIKLVGSDGGLYEREEFIDSVIIAPSERYIIEVFFDNEGEYQIKNVNPIKSYVLGRVIVSNEMTNNDLSGVFNVLKENPKTKTEIEQYREFSDKSPDVTMKLSIDMSGMHGNMMEGMMEEHEEDGIEWEDTMAMMNRQMTSDFLTWEIIDGKTGRKNMDIDYNWKVGDIVKIRIFNDPNSMHPMQHPIHFHGNRFLVLAEDGIKNDNLVWKDTVLVPVGKEVDILLEISNPGEWMAHCHIAEHLSSGMMTSFKVS